MKHMICVALLATVAACSETAPTPEATAEAPVEAAAGATAAPTGAVMAADGKSSVGKFQVTTHDGKVIMEEVKADGTYMDTIDGKVVETGKWVQKSPSEYCFTKDEPTPKEKCNTEKVENGVWTSTNAEGKTATVVRVEG